ncbi:YdcF family protein [Enemella evansiae]|uniref:YdcF family protein n=1 Tax=Enemella evansiae TaxID=2016499 RepID=UPI0015C60CB0|nr:ElyC/SanA/YdcF family protein [Enemella evansiae]
MRASTTRPRVLRRLLIATGALGLLWFGGCLKWFRYPATDEPRSTDAAYVLASGGGVARVGDGDLDALPGRTIVLSVSDVLAGRPDYQEACAQPDVVCLSPDPVTTRGEARVFAELARERGWRSVTVVTHQSHITRSRMLMKRCFPGEVRMQAIDAENGRRAWAYAFAYETGAMIKAQLIRSC